MAEAKQTKHHQRLTIGYLCPWISDPVFQTVWGGVDDAARQYGLNLICAPGGVLPRPPQYQYRNVAYDLLTPETIDAVIMWGDALSIQISAQEFAAFCRKYRPLPMVSIGQAMAGIPGISADNAQGMRALVNHLVEVHGFRHIAFITGPETHSEATQRYRAYVETLTEHDIPLDPRLVAPGDFTRATGAEAIRLLFDQRALRVGADVEAIVAANDDTAIGAQEALVARGISVPRDVALVGFDDQEGAEYAIPPLTTVCNPFHEIGSRAVEVLLAQIEGRDIPEQISLPTQLVVRQSCGCMLPIVARAAPKPVLRPPAETLPESLSARREHILTSLEQTANIPPGKTDPTWAERLLDAFIAEIKDPSAEAVFLPALESALCGAASAGLQLSTWQDVLSALRDQVLPCLSCEEALRAEASLGQARVLVGDAAQRDQGRQGLRLAEHILYLPDIDYALGSWFDMAGLLNVAAQEIPKVGIPSCYISLFEDPEAPTDWSRLIMAYEQGKRIDLGKEGWRFPSCQLVPGNLLPSERRYSLVLEPLHLRDVRLGFVLFEAEPSKGDIYEVLRRQISSALQNVLLLQAREEAEAALEQAYAGVEKQVEARTAELYQEVAERKRAEQALQHRLEQLAALSQASRAVTISLNLKQVLAEIVYLANEVVDSDYTSVLLVDEKGGIGQSAENLPGVQALEYRVRDRGLTSWIVRSRRAAVVDKIEADGTIYPDLGEGAPQQANPVLVQAGIKSLVGLPLMVKDHLLGVLYLHSLHPNAFGGQLFLLTAFANQAAIAIENARLFEAKQRQTQRLALLADIARIAATNLDADALLQAVAESICRILAYPLVSLFTLDDEGLTLIRRGHDTRAGSPNEPSEPQPYHHPVSEGIIGYVVRTGQTRLVPDVSSDPYFSPSPLPDIRSALCVPIFDEGGLVGVIDVESDRLAAFDEEDQALLEAVSDAVAIGLRNTRLYQETERRVRELTLVNSIPVCPSTVLDEDISINTALEGLRQLMSPDHLAFITIDPTTRAWKLTHEQNMPGLEPAVGLSGVLQETPAELTALMEKRVFTVSDAASDPRIAQTRPMYHTLGVKSLILVPVQVGGRLHGALGVSYRRERHIWLPDEIRLLESVAHQLELVLENARLFEETQLRADELSAALDRLEELDRLKDEFIQNVSHELRSPLALIRGYAEMIDSGELGETPEEQRKPIAIIARRARMLSDLVKDITLILEAEANPPQPEPVPLDELARTAVEDFQVEAEQAELSLRVEIAPDLPPASCAYTYLRRVLDNLLGNAVKFTPAGGTITVRVDRRGDEIALEVNDTGVGIPADKLGRIFDRFYQVDGSARRRYGGVGLGLALVKEIVETYGGRVTVESQPNVGSTFTAFLPIFTQAATTKGRY